LKKLFFEFIQGTLSNQTVILKVTDLLTAVDGNYPICDAVTREGMPG